MYRYWPTEPIDQPRGHNGSGDWIGPLDGRSFRSQGITLSLPDTLIGATALLASIPFYTCNPRHYPMPDLDLRAMPI